MTTYTIYRGFKIAPRPEGGYGVFDKTGKLVEGAADEETAFEQVDALKKAEFEARAFHVIDAGGDSFTDKP
jgi:hypothetical protein